MVPAPPAVWSWHRRGRTGRQDRAGPSDEERPAQPHSVLTRGQGVPREKPPSCHLTSQPLSPHHHCHCFLPPVWCSPYLRAWGRAAPVGPCRSSEAWAQGSPAGGDRGSEQMGELPQARRAPQRQPQGGGRWFRVRAPPTGHKDWEPPVNNLGAKPNRVPPAGGLHQTGLHRAWEPGPDFCPWGHGRAPPSPHPKSPVPHSQPQAERREEHTSYTCVLLL